MHTYMYMYSTCMHVHCTYNTPSTHWWLLFSLQSDALHQVQQQLAGHGLNADGQSVVMDVLGEEVHGQREVGEGEVCPDVVDQVSQDAVG